MVTAVFIPVKFGPQLEAHSHLLFGIFVTIVLAGFFFPRRLGIAAGWLMDRTFFRILGSKKDKSDSDSTTP
jgi:hypothetical protein